MRKLAVIGALVLSGIGACAEPGTVPQGRSEQPPAATAAPSTPASCGYGATVRVSPTAYKDGDTYVVPDGKLTITVAAKCLDGWMVYAAETGDTGCGPQDNADTDTCDPDPFYALDNGAKPILKQDGTKTVTLDIGAEKDNQVPYRLSLLVVEKTGQADLDSVTAHNTQPFHLNELYDAGVVAEKPTTIKLLVSHP